MGFRFGTFHVCVGCCLSRRDCAMITKIYSPFVIISLPHPSRSPQCRVCDKLPGKPEFLALLTFLFEYFALKSVIFWSSGPVFRFTNLNGSKLIKYWYLVRFGSYHSIKNCLSIFWQRICTLLSQGVFLILLH